MKIAFALAMLALASCDAPPADGYRFGKAEYERDRVVVNVVAHQSLADLRAAGAKAGAMSEGRDVMAWSSLSRDRAACTIHIVDPARAYAPEWLGHEVAHCFYGRWHK